MDGKSRSRPAFHPNNDGLGARGAACLPRISGKSDGDVTLRRNQGVAHERAILPGWNRACAAVENFALPSTCKAVAASPPPVTQSKVPADG
jgi:hypothetical protein